MAYFGILDYNGTTIYIDTGSGAGTTASPYCGKVTFIGDGTNQWKSGAAANIDDASSIGAMMVTPPGNWTAYHAPAVNTQATISKGAVASTRHVVTSVSGTVGADATGGTPAICTINLRDSTTGAGNILASWTFFQPTTANVTVAFNFGPFNIFGVAGQAVTLESATAPGAHSFCSVVMVGYSCT